MLKFLSNNCIATALTIQPFTYYIEYLKEFWYTGKVDGATNTITLSLSNFDKPLSFNRDKLISVIGLDYSENYVLVPAKEIVRAGFLCNTLSSVWEVDIGNIIFSDLVAKLQDGKKGREPNVYYTRFLSLMIEHLLGENYYNDELTSLKTHTILAASFKKPLASEVALSSYMLKVAKLLTESEETLILSSGKVNADDIIDKSLPVTTMQPPDGETAATADATLSLDASKSAKEQGNQLKPVDATKVHENIYREEDDDLVTDYGIKSLGNVTFADLYGNNRESPYDTKSEIKFIGKEYPHTVAVNTLSGSLLIHQEKAASETNDDGIEIILIDSSKDAEAKENDSDLESMPGDEIESLSGFEEDETDDDHHQSKHKEEFSKADEAAADNSDPLSHHPADFSSLVATINNLESSLSQKIADKIKESVPRMVADALEERLHEMLFDTLKNILLDLLKDSRKLFPKNNMIVDLQKKLTKAINIKVSKSVQRSVRKEVKVVNQLLKYCIMQIDKNDINLRELVDLIRDLVILIDTTSASAKVAPEGENMSTQENKDLEITIPAIAYGEQHLMNTTEPKTTEEEQPPIKKVKSSKEEPLVKKLKFYVPDFTIPSPQPLNSVMPQGIRPPIIINNIPFDQYTANLFSSSSFEFSLTPPPIVADKGKGISNEEDPIKQLMPLMDE
ncbi:hypothetical protein Tco_0071656 [Tanacetum coccineum]